MFVCVCAFVCVFVYVLCVYMCMCNTIMGVHCSYVCITKLPLHKHLCQLEFWTYPNVRSNFVI